ncbi:ABC transporter permease [Trinickia symbiotica]|uniref:ABC transporter permease n=1 Tax=Trinickia symbiotica TaxID=863227 RepID=A0A2T3XRA4_9BURK|nr:ABC transporter permease [Trinickia symbiotica]PTB19051.1 ABC transporter permease [Trinickia symbiotica]
MAVLISQHEVPSAGRKRISLNGSIGTIVLLTPLIAFMSFFFFLPIGIMMSRSFYDPEPSLILSKTKDDLKQWQPAQGLPNEVIVSDFAQEITQAEKQHQLSKVGDRMKDRMPMASQLLRSAATAVSRSSAISPLDALVRSDPAWRNVNTWSVLKSSLSSVYPDKYLGALDLVRSPNDKIVPVDDGSFVNLRTFWRTIWMSGAICLACLILGYPVAYLMCQLSPSKASICMTAVLIPYWTSALVRTTGWIVLLQREGVVNKVLMALGLLAPDRRFSMIFNMSGTLIVMVHVLLPVMILPLYSVMLKIPPSQMRAATSLGAHPLRAFATVFVPLSRPGIAGGVTLVFMLSVGFYATPALVGGAHGTFIGNIIAYHMQTSLNWGLAAALSSLLFALVLGIYVFYAGRVARGGKVFA